MDVNTGKPTEDHLIRLDREDVEKVHENLVSRKAVAGVGGETAAGT